MKNSILPIYSFLKLFFQNYFANFTMDSDPDSITVKQELDCDFGHEVHEEQTIHDTSLGTDNPWYIQSIYDLQYFICPSCAFKDHSKQEFIDHVYNIHPDSIEHLFNIKDDSVADIVFPNYEIKEEFMSNIKVEIKEERIFDESYEDPLYTGT